MRIKRILTPSEVDKMVADAGCEPQKRQEGAVTDQQIEQLNRQLGLTKQQPEDNSMFSVVNATNRIRKGELEELAKEISLDRADNKNDKHVVKFSQATPDERKTLVTAISQESNGTQAELSSRAESIQNMIPVRIKNKPVSRDEFIEIINNIGNEIVVDDDGMHVSFSSKSIDKLFNLIMSETGAANEVVKLLKSAKYAYSQPHNNTGTIREDGTIHPDRENVLEYRNYVNKFTNDVGTYYCRFVVMRTTSGDNKSHGASISEISISKENATGENTNGVLTGETLPGTSPFIHSAVSGYMLRPDA